ncbi:DUF6036 family nucleotidyltransferase [Devosia sp. Root635]|uniref:DUF6036 family nucleotidyltransferase n=1 Tax=Devosia sp. Root635 TaxID=1736575 RepID=UPI0006F27C6E|nr:DUF6036 family nucleotidyltransferase [Devosia sp. Root635]KRA47698.1 hypothetical protein ASD80_02550 [Devosia sp. Root635]
MNIDQLKHVLRAAAGITGQDIFVVVGSQAVLLQYPRLPDVMVMSAEIDMFPLNQPELADLIDGTIGSDSVFHETFGYHADGVGPTTARLPQSWRERAIVLPASAATGGASAVAPDIHDLAVAKLLAGRPKDLDWIAAGLAAGLMTRNGVAGLLPQADATQAEVDLALARLQRLGGASP